MKLPNFRRLLSSDYKSEFQGLVDQLSGSLNYGIDVLYNALNGEITLRDNIKCTIKDVIVTVDSNGIPLQTTVFTLKTTSRVDFVEVGSAINQTNAAHFPISAPFISGNQSANIFNISHISGLQANERYSLRVIAWQQ